MTGCLRPCLLLSSMRTGFRWWSSGRACRQPYPPCPPPPLCSLLVWRLWRVPRSPVGHWTRLRSWQRFWWSTRCPRRGPGPSASGPLTTHDQLPSTSVAWRLGRQPCSPQGGRHHRSRELPTQLLQSVGLRRRSRGGLWVQRELWLLGLDRFCLWLPALLLPARFLRPPWSSTPPSPWAAPPCIPSRCCPGLPHAPSCCYRSVASQQCRM